MSSVVDIREEFKDRLASLVGTRAKANLLYKSGLRPAQIAEVIGVSRARIYQILGRVGRPPLTCKRCGKELKLRGKGTSRICEDCLRKKPARVFTCPVCGGSIKIRPYELLVRGRLRKPNTLSPLFCSHKCAGRWWSIGEEEKELALSRGNICVYGK